MADATNKWKEKYYQALEEQEKLGQQLNALSQASQQIFTRVLAAAGDQDDALDSVLARLRKKIKGKMDPQSLQLELSPLSDAVIAFDKKQKARSKFSREMADQFLAVLEKLATSREDKKSLKNLAACRPKKSRDWPEFARHLNTWLLDINLADKNAEDTASVIKTPDNPAKSDKKDQLALEAVPHPAGQSSSNAENQSYEDLLKLSGHLATLVGQLSVPAAMEAQAQVLKDKLQGVRKIAQLPALVDEIAGLIQKLDRQDQEHMEAFAESISKRLEFFGEFLSLSITNEKNADQLQKSLAEDITGQVGDIRDQMHQADDLSSLKTVLETRIDDMMLSLARFQTGNDERTQLYQERIQSMEKELAESRVEVDALQKNLAEKERLGRLDALTGLPNRRAYDDEVRKEIKRVERNGSDLSLVVCDIDFFKKINDTFGHKAGDKVLKVVGRILAKHLRATDVAARYGGEEFVLLLPETATGDAQLVAEKIRLAIEGTPFESAGKQVKVTMSFGVTQLQTGDTEETLFERADAVLYKAKEQGRNRVLSA